MVEKLGYLRWFQKPVPASEDSVVMLALLCCPQFGFDIECPGGGEPFSSKNDFRDNQNSPSRQHLRPYGYKLVGQNLVLSPFLSELRGRSIEMFQNRMPIVMGILVAVVGTTVS